MFPKVWRSAISPMLSPRKEDTTQMTARDQRFLLEFWWRSLGTTAVKPNVSRRVIFGEFHITSADFFSHKPEIN
jgi:hypothetical protein